MIIKPKGLPKEISYFFIFILMVIPLFYIFLYFDEIANRKEQINEELIKESIIKESNAFEEDLNPEYYIEKAFNDLETTFGLPDSELDSNQYIFTFSEDEKPNYIDNTFIAKSNSFLKEKYGIEPFLFLSVDYDFSDYNLYDRENLLYNENAKNDFLFYNNCLCFSHDNFEKHRLEFVNPINLTENKLRIKEIIDFTTNKFFFVINEAFSLQVAKYISVFYKHNSNNKNSIPFYSNRFKNKISYAYKNDLLFKINNNKMIFLGSYLTFIKSSDIALDKLITNSYKKNNPTDVMNNVFRYISNEKLTSPKWEITEKQILYKTPFPSHLFSLIADQKNVNRDLYNHYYDFLLSHSMVVGINRNKINNDYRLYTNYMKSLISFCFIFFIIFILRIIFKSHKKAFYLTNKIKIVVIIAVGIPILCIWLLCSITIENEKNTLINRVVQHINTRFALFEKIKSDYETVISEKALEFRKIFIQSYFDKGFDDFIKYYKNSELYKSYQNSGLYEYSRILFLNNYGKILRIEPDGELGKTPKFPVYQGLYKTLYDLNLTDNTTKENIKNNEQLTLLSSYLDLHDKRYNSQNYLAKEGLIIPSETFEDNNNLIYSFIASKDNPNKPIGILSNNIKAEINNKNLIKSLIKNNNYLFSENYDFNKIEYSCFQQDEFNIFKIDNQKSQYPFNKMQLNAANLAVSKGVSGFEYSDKGSNYELIAWRYSHDDYPIFTASAIIPKQQNSVITGNILALILIIYTIFVVILLSDFLSKALLSPIQTLSNFVKEINKGNINITTQIDTGDEFEELAISFNKMSKGLCEREKLKRFVSDKLYSYLEKDETKEFKHTKVTLLSSDIRSFTTLSEQHNPEDIVSLLNDYFTIMENVITKYGGSIEKIVGDAILAAFFEDNDKNYISNACKAALEMRIKLKEFNDLRLSKGLFTIENGIGIATGDVIIGFAGEKSRRKELLLMSSKIKEAEKLESLTKEAISSKVFIDKTTFDIVNKEFEFCEKIQEEDIFYKELKL